MITIKQQTESRRPLALRELTCWKWLLGRAADRGLTPNQVSLLGMGFGLAASLFLVLTSLHDPGSALQRLLLLAAVLFVILRGACNIFDGILAVETGQASRLGLLFNEVPDRVSDIAILAGAGYAVGSHPALGWIAALGSLATAYLRVQVQLAGAAPDYSGPMAKPARMVVLCVAAGGLALLPGVWLGAPDLFLGLGLIGLALVIIVFGVVLTLIVRLYNAYQDLLPLNHDVPQ